LSAGEEATVYAGRSARTSTRLLLAVVVTAILISVLNQTFVNVVVPDIRDAYGATQGQVGWVITGYLLVFAVGIPLYGRVADLYSLRRTFAVGLAFLAAGSIACALAPSLPLLVAGRVLQAVGAAAIPALGFASVWLNVRPDPYGVPEPRLLFLLDKSFLSPARLMEFLALVLAFHGAYPHLDRRLGKLVRPLAQLGRNSLEVFAVGSVLALLAQLVRATLQPNVALDTFLVGSGILALVFTAWFSEWRSRSPKSFSSR